MDHTNTPATLRGQQAHRQQPADTQVWSLHVLLLCAQQQSVTATSITTTLCCQLHHLNAATAQQSGTHWWVLMLGSASQSNAL